MEQTLLTIIILLLFGYASFSSRKLRNKLYCHYTGQDKTEEDKWTTMKAGNVVFRGLKFDILPDRITSFWLTTGIHWFFPTRVNYAKFSWYSRWPHNPNNYNLTIMGNPAVRNAIDKSELVESYFKTSTPTVTKKQGMIAQYLPLVTIVLIVCIAFYCYSNFEAISVQFAAMQNSINAVTK